MRRCRLDECRAACCLYGVWADISEVEKILANAHLFLPHMPNTRQNPNDWFTSEFEEDEFTPGGKVRHSNVLSAPDHYGGTECVFLRSDHKCALQVAATALGQPDWVYKPFYCILHPLDLDDHGRITLDETSELLAEPGSCLRSSADLIPLMDTFEPELRYFLGDQEFFRLRKTKLL